MEALEKPTKPGIRQRKIQSPQFSTRKQMLDLEALKKQRNRRVVTVYMTSRMAVIHKTKQKL